MRIAMLCPQGVPPVRGGAERLWAGIVDQINAKTTHVAEMVSVDSPEHSFTQLVQSYTRFDELDMSAYDLVITGKYPAWMVRHERHVVYMCHPLRGLYDAYHGPADVRVPHLSPVSRRLANVLMWSTPGRPGARAIVLESANEVIRLLPADHPDLQFPGPLIRRLVHWLDRDALHPSNSSALLAISRTVAGRPGYFPNASDVEVVVPPTGLDGLHSADGRHLFTASRLDDAKRIDLLVDAMRFVRSDVELRIGGDGPAGENLRRRARGDARVKFLGHIDDVQLTTEYAGAIAVPFVPRDEDLGLIALEAQLSGKPVITCNDSGGVTELVENDVNGLVVPPTAEALGHAMQQLIDDPRRAYEMGREGRRRAHGITWDAVTEALLRDRARSTITRSSRPAIVVLSTYPARPARHGGQIRLNRLLTSLAERADVHLLAIGPAATGPELADDGFAQSTFHPTAAYHDLDERLTAAVGVHTSDIVASLLTDQLGGMHRAVPGAASAADAVVLAHPYLYPLVRDLPVRKLVYDAHNAETQLKRDMYLDNETGRAVLAAVREIEAAALGASDLVTAVSSADVEALQSLGPTMAEFRVVPNGADLANQPFVTGHERRANRDRYLDSLASRGFDHRCTSIAVFLGSGHPPNVEAAINVLAAALDLPKTLFVLVGSHIHHFPGTPIARNVVPRGEVSNFELRTLLRSCDIALNPMVSGSGTNIKMVDYFAAGAPVVASAIGARGLGARRGVHYIEADATELAKAIDAALDNPSMLDENAAAGRTLAEQLDWQLIGTEFARHVLRGIGCD